MKSPREALEITKKYWRNVPVAVADLARELSLGPAYDATLPANVAGLIRREPSGAWQIVVNSQHSEARQRFTIAHEIGHFIYHRERLDAGTSDTLAYRIDGHIYPNPQIGPAQEWQANTFAANLLVPSVFLRAALASGISDEVELADHFKVSRAAIRIRLGLPTLDNANEAASAH